MTERQFDRRRRKRIDVALPVILENATAVTRDASASGVFFWKPGTFMYGDFIRFAIERNTDTGRILQKCRGVVVRTEPDDNGVGVAARITESTTERVPGQPPGPESLEPAREEPRDVARPADNAPAPANEAVSPGSARDVPPALAPPAEDKPASVEKTAALDSGREEPPTIVLPADDGPAPAEKTALLESAREEAPTVSRDTAREQLPTIAWPTDEAFFSPDKTVSLRAAREQPRADTQPLDSAPASGDDSDSLDFVHEHPVTIAQQRVDALASAIPTINRWSSLLRDMALDAREELQGQEVLEWNIPSAADASTVHSRRLTVCSVTVVGLRPDESRAPGDSRNLGVSYRDLVRLRASGGPEARRTASGAGVGVDSRFVNQRSPPDARGLRIELAIRVADGSSGDRTAGGTLLPSIVVRITSVPDDRQHEADAYCYEETAYGDPREAFEAFMRLAGESAILVNLALLNT
jgi:hypothetical protein